VSRGLTDLDTKLTFIANLAYYLFETERTSLTIDEVREVAQKYYDFYSIRVDANSVLRDLETARVLCRIEGNYRFTYPYYYYYFVAKYLSDSLRDPTAQESVRTRLRDMADRLFFEEYSNILMFVIYLSRDVELISHLLANAKLIYASQNPCDFANDIDFINTLYKNPPKLILPPSDINAHREKKRREMDEISEEGDEGEIDENEAQKIKYDEQLSDLIKVNIAFKTLRLLGKC